MSQLLQLVNWYSWYVRCGRWCVCPQNTMPPGGGGRGNNTNITPPPPPGDPFFCVCGTHGLVLLHNFPLLRPNARPSSAPLGPRGVFHNDWEATVWCGHRTLWTTCCRSVSNAGGRGRGAGGGGQGVFRRDRTSEAAPEAVRSAVGGGSKAVRGGFCQLQMPLKLAVAVRETVAGHRLGALKGGGVPPPFPMHPWGGGGG